MVDLPPVKRSRTICKMRSFTTVDEACDAQHLVSLRQRYFFTTLRIELVQV